MTAFTHPLTIDSPPSGEHFTFHRSARSPGGRFEFTYRLAPGKTGPGEHRHPEESHVFTLIEGELAVWLDGVRRDYKAGDTLTIPGGCSHRYKNFGKVHAVAVGYNDGPAFEDFAVPLAIEQQRRGGKMTLGAMALVLVQAMHCDPSKPTGRGRFAFGIAYGIARVARLFGVRPLPPVYGWDRDAPPAPVPMPPVATASSVASAS